MARADELLVGATVTLEPGLFQTYPWKAGFTDTIVKRFVENYWGPEFWVEVIHVEGLPKEPIAIDSPVAKALILEKEEDWL